MAFAPILLAAAMSASSPDSVPRPITLDEAITLARQNAPQVIQAHGQARTSAAAVRSAYSAFIPSVSVSATGTRQSGTRIENGQVVTQPWSFTTGLSANVTLFSGGQRIFDLRQARARERSAGANETIQEYDAIFAVKEQFFNVLAARESEAAARAQLDQAQHQFRLSTAQFRAGIVTRSDSLRAEIQVRNAQLALIQALNSIEVSSASLTRAVGSPVPVTAAPGDTTGQFGLSISDEELRNLAESGPAVQQARTNLEAARAARQSAWSGYLPTVTAGYSRSRSAAHQSFDPLTGEYTYRGAASLSLSFPIFNQYQREEQITQARVAEANAAASLRDALLAAREGYAQGFGAYRTASERVATQIATVAAAEEDLRLQQQRYNLGASTLLDVLTSQTQLDQARSDLIRARYDRRIAKAQLEALVGRNL